MGMKIGPTKVVYESHLWKRLQWREQPLSQWVMQEVHLRVRRPCSGCAGDTQRGAHAQSPLVRRAGSSSDGGGL